MAHARAAGVELLALTDHDTVDGVQAALDAAGDGLRVVPATELSVVDAELGDLHLLGYAIDHRAPVFLDSLADWRDDRRARIDAMVTRLEQAGWALEDSELERRRAAGEPLGRPHLAAAVLAAPRNAARLAGVADVGAFIERHLVPGAPAFVPRTRPTLAEAVAVVHAAGGLAVWAHPFFDVSDPPTVAAAVRRMARDDGIDGVEAFYITHDEHQTRLLHRSAVELGLLATGSADFHGPHHARFNRFRAFELYNLEPRLNGLAR